MTRGLRWLTLGVALLVIPGCEDSAQVLRRADASAPGGEFRVTEQVGLGERHACIIRDGSVLCAGDNDALALGRTGAGSSRFEPIDAALPRLVDVGVSISASCVLDEAGVVRCFGSNEHGLLGDETTPSGASPVPVALAGPAVRVAVDFHSCAILQDASLHCWGANQECQLANPDRLTHGDPQPVMPGTGFVEVAVGQGHACAVSIDGTLWCWGRNNNGQLGIGEGTEIQYCAPQRVPGGPFRHVSCGQASTCAIAIDGALWCWGEDLEADGHSGAVGLPGAGIYASPQRVSAGPGWTRVAIGSFHGCGVRAGELYCWGRNAEGQLGLGDPSQLADVPRRIDARGDWVDVGVSALTTCATTQLGEVFCAGANRSGELGVGDATPRSVLTPVE